MTARIITNHFSATRFTATAIAATMIALISNRAHAQFYDFDTDGEFWPETIDPDGGYDTFDGVGIFNFTFEEQHRVDAGYTDIGVGLGNASTLSGNAWYGGYEDFAFVGIDFFFFGGGDAARSSSIEGTADSVAFDIAVNTDLPFVEVAFFGPPTDPEDPEGGFRFDSFEIPNPFDTPAGIGWEGRIEINATDYGLDGIEFIDITPVPPVPVEFASDATFALGFAGIDNISINDATGGGGGGGDPLDSDIHPGDTPDAFLVGVSANFIRQEGSFTSTFPVINQGTSATTYSVLYGPGVTDPGFFDVPSDNVPIGAGEVRDPGAGFSVDLDQPSGERSGVVTVTNDLNPGDTDDDVTITAWIHDHAVLSANNDEPVDPAVSSQVTVANDPAGPHPDALRASARLDSLSASGDGFGFSEDSLVVDGHVIAGEPPVTADVTHDPAGLLNGTHNGLLTADFSEQNHDGTAGVVDGTNHQIQWELIATVTGSTGGTASRDAGESYAGLGAAMGETAVEIRDGDAGEDGRVVTMIFEMPDLAAGDETLSVVGIPVDVSFNVAGDAFVLQVGYDDTGLSPTEENALRLLFFDDALGDYINAVLGNSNAGTVGETLFVAKSYDEYLAEEAPGGVFELGAHGVDTNNNNVWAAIDHTTLFAAAVIPEPATVTLVSMAFVLMTNRHRAES